MDTGERKRDLLSVEELTGQQVHISIITVILNLLCIALSLFLKADAGVMLGFALGCLVGILFHWWLYHDLSVAITLESTQAVRYANMHSLIRNIALILVLLLLLVNKVLSVNLFSLIAGLLSIKPVIYIYNMFKAAKYTLENEDEY